MFEAFDKKLAKGLVFEGGIQPLLSISSISKVVDSFKMALAQERSTMEDWVGHLDTNWSPGGDCIMLKDLMKPEYNY